MIHLRHERVLLRAVLQDLAQAGEDDNVVRLRVLRAELVADEA
jgi:hypothetical protein